MQDRLRESGQLVWQLLQQGAHFYVCGDAAHMAGSVEQALLHIIQQHQVGLATLLPTIDTGVQWHVLPRSRTQH